MPSLLAKHVGRPSPVELGVSLPLDIAHARHVRRIVFADHAQPVDRPIAADPTDIVEVEARPHSSLDRTQFVLGERRFEIALNNDAGHRLSPIARIQSTGLAWEPPLESSGRAFDATNAARARTLRSSRPDAASMSCAEVTSPAGAS